jgi:hypothetical protein
MPVTKLMNPLAPFLNNALEHINQHGHHLVKETLVPFLPHGPHNKQDCKTSESPLFSHGHAAQL